ncbi:MAG: hypothetical protein U5L96_09480 [Owenweeksia sp.]|nr:hypothetical protein [Owenweeksia sp.]
MQVFGYTTTGNYVDTLVATNGCDSIRHLNLTVLPGFNTSENRSICQGETYKGFSSSGTYVQNLTANNGCDSSHTIQLNVAPVYNVSITDTILPGRATFWTPHHRYFYRYTFFCSRVVIVFAN